MTLIGLNDSNWSEPSGCVSDQIGVPGSHDHSVGGGERFGEGQCDPLLPQSNVEHPKLVLKQSWVLEGNMGWKEYWLYTKSKVLQSSRLGKMPTQKPLDDGRDMFQPVRVEKACTKSPSSQAPKFLSWEGLQPVNEQMMSFLELIISATWEGVHC